ncbi:MAG: 3-isopropylmalate dehydratase small subunit [Candidatus Omnitrophica bacterium CG1_02_46_14]|nr:MAG: 3-isopropylmalate dehydratase small subunit [Candidatus Omnitrophica bacterium CG1_02_46_14]
MKPLKSHKGLVATLDRSNVDTDQIIAKQFLKSIARTGFGEHLFSDWRTLSNGQPNPNFSLNRPRFKGASILVARNNFGCGSSREHAVWSIYQYGFQVVVASSFADIFKNNCSKNALLTIELSETDIEKIFQAVDSFPGLEATADVENQKLTLHLPKEVSFHFKIDPGVKDRLIHGLDDIGITLKNEAALIAFEKSHDVQIATGIR